MNDRMTASERAKFVAATKRSRTSRKLRQAPKRVVVNLTLDQALALQRLCQWGWDGSEEIAKNPPAMQAAVLLLENEIELAGERIATRITKRIGE